MKAKIYCGVYGKRAGKGCKYSRPEPKKPGAVQYARCTKVKCEYQVS